MRILWLSNKILLDGDDCGTGGWLNAMAHRLTHTNDVVLGNITEGEVSDLTRLDAPGVVQWAVPAIHSVRRNGMPSKKITDAILTAIREFSPDLIHIWGTEGCWGMLTVRGLIGGRILLEMQGLKRAIAPVFAGGLTFHEQLACVGLKELARRSFISAQRREFEAWGVHEQEIISHHHDIAVQTDWMGAQVKLMNPDARIFHTDRLLRDPFLSSPAWRYTGRHTIFCSSSYSSPFKGIHVAVRAAALLRDVYPDIELRIAGAHQRTGLRRDGYIAWICREIEQLNLESHVVWLGSLSADELVAELSHSSAVVIPSFVENCCNALSESMAVGAPAVVSYTGGTSYLASDETSALFFQAGDAVMCAHQCHRLISEQGLAERISACGKETACKRNNPGRVFSQQLAIYRAMLSTPGKGIEDVHR
jgi:L-malate glycosyltransferase